MDVLLSIGPDVEKVLIDVISEAGFEPNLVSNSNESGIIQNFIVENLYSNEMIVCDVSGKTVELRPFCFKLFLGYAKFSVER